MAGITKAAVQQTAEQEAVKASKTLEQKVDRELRRIANRGNTTNKLVVLFAIVALGGAILGAIAVAAI